MYRYDPRRVARGEPPLFIDVPPGRTAVAEYMRNETRFRMVERIDQERFRRITHSTLEGPAKRELNRVRLRIALSDRSAGGWPGGWRFRR